MERPGSRPTAARWLVRVVVVGAFVLTVWLGGPKAAAVLAARFEASSRQSPTVVLDRAGVVAQPDWMDRPLLLAVSAALSPWLAGEVAILDDAAQRQLRDGLAAVPWVRAVGVERVFPDRLRLRCELRRPVLAVRDAEGRPLCLVDDTGLALPWVDTPSVPVTFLHHEGGAGTMKVVPGAPVTEPRVRAAAGIAVEWRDQLAPLVSGCPALLEIDATNLGERWLGPRFPELRIKLRRDDGAGVVFAYDRPVDSPLPRVPVLTKAKVLGNVLAKYPGLGGLVAGDLRFSIRWLDYLQPRPLGVRDPFEPWNALPPARGG